MSGFRLASGGTAIDRSRPVPFLFNGRAYLGLHGDTLASALIASGVDTLARSFKYHRPRGILAAGIEEPNAHVQLLAPFEEPNVRATTLPLVAGLSAASVNCWPGVTFDVGALADFLHPLLPAGFYYKTFMGPPGDWPWFERFIRRAAGLGRAPRARAPVGSQRRYAHCDVLVVGAGPAGLAAAQVAARSRLRVILADQQDLPGASAELDEHTNILRLPGTTVTGLHDHNFVTAVERIGLEAERLWKIRARRIVVATGAIERPLIFPGNDKPGVMLLSAVQSFAHRYAAAAGRRVVVLTNHSGAYPVALELLEAGITVAAIVDVREDVSRQLAERAQARGVDVMAGHTVLAVRGRRRVDRLVVARMDGLNSAKTLDCDTVAMTGGWTPTVHLHAQAAPAAGLVLAGAANRCLDFASCVRDGAEAGAAMVRSLGRVPAGIDLPQVSPGEPLDAMPLWELPSRGGRAFVDFANDVTADDLRLAAREGYASIELAKRYTTAGMGLDQGKTGAVNAAQVLAAAVGVDPGLIGLTTARPPFTPVAFGTIAGGEDGELIRPLRETPITPWHLANGAVMYESGANWRRPGYYLQAGESMADAVRRECLAVRHAAGLYDGSPLGKFEVAGAFAAEFLDGVYATRVGDLAPGRGRYALMLREDGRLFDDGVVFRLGERRFWLTTTTGNADAVHAWLEYLSQCVWPGQVFILPVSAQWANLVLCGPRARELLEALGTDIDLSPRSFPFMAVREGRLGGVAARVFRVSFTGELSFEINVRAREGLRLWESLLRTGEALGIQPVGSEANHVLRIEKGYISIGHEADGMANPFDLGLDRFVAMDKPDFIGRRSLAPGGFAGGVRRQLVGLLSDAPEGVLPEGAQVLLEGARQACGFVSASVASPVLQRSVALAMIDDGRSRLGAAVRVTLDQGEAGARVVAPIFYDPQGTRLRG